MPLPSVVSVPFYDPSRRSGAAFLLSVVSKDSVKVKFIVGGGRAQKIALSRLSAEDQKAVTSWYTDEGGAFASSPPPSASGPTASPPWKPFEKKMSTWHRLLFYGGLCRSGHALSDTGMRALWGVVLPDRANEWLDKMSSLPLKSLLSHFITVWWHYCCACAHTKVESLTARQRVLVLELMCFSMQQKGSKHCCVFSALLMQIIVLFCHDQSLCYVGADLNDVGYNYRVDCGKIGPVVKFSALLRHAGKAECALTAVSRVREPKSCIVWLLQKPSLKFRRLRKYRLYDKFLSAEGKNTRLEVGTNRIKFWNEDAEDYVYADDFHTTLDGVVFKRCGDQLQEGDVWLENGGKEWIVESIEPQGSSGRPPVVVHLRRQGETKSMHCPYNRTIPLGTKKKCMDAITFLRENPDVVDTMCLSTGPSPEHMRKSRSRTKLGQIRCNEIPIQCSWEEYLLWRCVVSAAVSSMDEQGTRVATPFINRARLAWLVV